MTCDATQCDATWHYDSVSYSLYLICSDDLSSSISPYEVYFLFALYFFSRKKMAKLLTLLTNERQHFSSPVRSLLFYLINATRVSGRTRVNRYGGCLASKVHMHRTMIEIKRRHRGTVRETRGIGTLRLGQLRRVGNIDRR